MNMLIDDEGNEKIFLKALKQFRRLSTEQMAETLGLPANETEEVLFALEVSGFVRRIEDPDGRVFWELTEAGGREKPKMKLSPPIDPSSVELKIGDRKAWRAQKEAGKQIAAAKEAALMQAVDKELDPENARPFESWLETTWLEAIDRAEEQWTMDANAPMTAKKATGKRQ